MIIFNKHDFIISYGGTKYTIYRRPYSRNKTRLFYSLLNWKSYSYNKNKIRYETTSYSRTNII